MKNYYEILEVDIHASSEMIERAFKLLAKRYHPDTQPQEKKQWAEEEFKKINEAYEVLSNKDTRKAYSEELEFEKSNELNLLYNEKESLAEQVRNLQLELNLLKNNKNMNDYNFNVNNINTNSYSFDNDYSQEYKKNSYYEQPTPPYYESYYHPLKSKLKNLLAFVLTVLAFILLSFLIWKIPFTKNWLISLYENNFVLKSIADIFINLF